MLSLVVLFTLLAVWLAMKGIIITMIYKGLARETRQNFHITLEMGLPGQTFHMFIINRKTPFG